MVIVVQLVERQIVILFVVGSSPIGHPILKTFLCEGFFISINFKHLKTLEGVIYNYLGLSRYFPLFRWLVTFGNRFGNTLALLVTIGNFFKNKSGNTW